MPTYAYECGACGHAFELFQSMSAPVKRKCPECGANKLQRLIGRGAAVLFKGSGFYETDYRSESYKKGSSSESSDSSKSSSEKSSSDKSSSDKSSSTEKSSKPKSDKAKDS